MNEITGKSGEQRTGRRRGTRRTCRRRSGAGTLCLGRRRTETKWIPDGIESRRRHRGLGKPQPRSSSSSLFLLPLRLLFHLCFWFWLLTQCCSNSFIWFLCLIDGNYYFTETYEPVCFGSAYLFSITQHYSIWQLITIQQVSRACSISFLICFCRLLFGFSCLCFLQNNFLSK
jgi:hypothetical protein